MFNFLSAYRVHILLGCACASLMLACFVIIIKFNSIRRKKALFKIQAGIAALLFFDALTYIYQGDMSNTGFWMVRISNFCVYFFTAYNINFLTEYLTALFMESGKFEKLPRRLLLGYILPPVQVTLILVSLLAGWIYYIDEFNNYVRGQLYFAGYILPFVSMMMLLSFVFQHRKSLERKTLWSLFLFFIIPVLAAVLQLFYTEASFINLSSWFAAVTVFWFALSDQNDELVKAANTDLTTGLPNTYGFLYEVDRVIHFQDITEYCGMYIDIVRMSHINNKYGKAAGDNVIVLYAQELRKKLDKSEVVGRLGGNFFVALVKKSNIDEFIRFLQGVPVEFQVANRNENVNVAAVAGIYEIKKKNIAAGQILSNTATAVTYAKNVAHKPFVFLDEELEKELNNMHILEEHARKGLMKNEFEPFYQPKVDTRTNELNGAEALARWRKDGELIPPFKFVPVMENNGSICDLDFYILENVCRDIKGWIEAGVEPVPVSVNFSRKNLGNPILAEAISKVVEKHEIPKDLIQIEITETIDEFPLSYLIGVVEALQRYGLTVAIDDFGTGSSSIKLLKDVRFDVLKIDRAFVNYEDETGEKLLKNIIHMADDIGLNVVAEGVETKEQMEDLKAMQCYEIQGFIFDKPLSKPNFEKKLKNKKYQIDG